MLKSMDKNGSGRNTEEVGEKRSCKKKTSQTLDFFRRTLGLKNKRLAKLILEVSFLFLLLTFLY